MGDTGREGFYATQTDRLVAERDAARAELTTLRERIRALADDLDKRSILWKEVSEDDKDPTIRKRAASLASDFSARSTEVRALSGDV